MKKSPYFRDQLFNRDEEGQEDRDKSMIVARSESTSHNMCHFLRNNHINDLWFFATMIIYMIRGFLNNDHIHDSWFTV
jgi:hypothetical protein